MVTNEMTTLENMKKVVKRELTGRLDRVFMEIWKLLWAEMVLLTLATIMGIIDYRTF